MAVLEQRNMDSGLWINLLVREAVTLSAHRADKEDATPLTVYWRGRTNPEMMQRFFTSSLRKDVINTVSMRAFTPKENLRFDSLRNPDDLRKKVPEDACFLRLEANSRRDGLPPGEDNFIVWSRVDLATVPPDSTAPDDIGVFLSSAHLHDIQEKITRFIVATHIAAVSDNDVSDCVQVLAAYLRPDRLVTLDA